MTRVFDIDIGTKQIAKDKIVDHISEVSPIIRGIVEDAMFDMFFEYPQDQITTVTVYDENTYQTSMLVHFEEDYYNRLIGKFINSDEILEKLHNKIVDGIESNEELERIFK